MNWPPKTATEMLAIQKRHGRDEDIACAFGISRYRVEVLRAKLKVPTLPLPERLVQSKGWCKVISAASRRCCRSERFQRSTLAGGTHERYRHHHARPATGRPPHDRRGTLYP